LDKVRFANQALPRSGSAFYFLENIMEKINGEQRTIRIALPSKGRLAEEALALMKNAGLAVKKTNPRQYEALIPSLEGVSVLFQRPGDIAVSVRDGIVDFGITGFDVVTEKQNQEADILVMLDQLGFGECRFCAIVPEDEEAVSTMKDLSKLVKPGHQNLRVATKFPNITRRFFAEWQMENVSFIVAEGALEIAPTIGYADMITDLVSTGMTLRDNRLKILEDGLILESQACLIGNRQNLLHSPAVMEIARRLLEFIIAYLRAQNNIAIYANIRGDSPETVAALILGQKVIRGLQGPTISRVITHQGENWYAAHLIVSKNNLAEVIREIRQIGGSGVVVTPVNYIFEEEPEAYQQMLRDLGVADGK
jgi:ATP phosphoribosyltransferase